MHESTETIRKAAQVCKQKRETKTSLMSQQHVSIVKWPNELWYQINNSLNKTPVLLKSSINSLLSSDLESIYVIPHGNKSMTLKYKLILKAHLLINESYGHFRKYFT